VDQFQQQLMLTLRLSTFERQTPAGSHPTIDPNECSTYYILLLLSSPVTFCSRRAPDILSLYLWSFIP
jgi:hypothetical protein